MEEIHSESVPKAKGVGRNEGRRSQEMPARGSVRANGAGRSSDSEGSSKGTRGEKIAINHTSPQPEAHPILRTSRYRDKRV